MRHLGSLIAGILIAPVAWVLIALGQQKTTATVTPWLGGGAFNTADLIVPAAFVVAAGVLIGLIGTLRFSPIGALIVGVVYVALFVALFITPQSTLNAVPHNLRGLGQSVDLRVPIINGTLLIVGILLLVAAFSVKRWRRWPQAAPAVVSTPAGDDSYEPTAVLTPETAFSTPPETSSFPAPQYGSYSPSYSSSTASPAPPASPVSVSGGPTSGAPSSADESSAAREATSIFWAPSAFS
jgi:hypothetical protein